MLDAPTSGLGGAGRSEMMKVAAGALLAAGAVGKASAQLTSTSTILQRLVMRITYFPTPYELQIANQLGFDAYLNYHLNHTAIPDPEMPTRLALFPSINYAITDLLVGNSFTYTTELTNATFIRAVYSRRQLFERMVEFWTDHFNIDINDMGVYKLPDDRDVIRKHALGKFPDMLRASARSVAMLRYLDNDTNRRGRPNQNYARELLELHTMGVDGGYTQTDVENVARCFTGWTYDAGRTRSDDASTGGFLYNHNNHDTDAKVVLGNLIPSGGNISDGNTVLDILVQHPSTARYISKKMIMWFLGPDPSPILVDAVAAVYLATGGDIKEMIREILTPKTMQHAPAKLKRPFHLFAGAMRAVRAELTTASTIAGTQLSRAGHQSFRWNPPDGYPDTFEYWSSFQLPRWNFMASVMTGGVSGVTLDSNVLGFTLTNVTSVLDKINEIVFFGTMDTNTRTSLQTFLSAATLTSTRIRDAYGLALSSPQWQWY